MPFASPAPNACCPSQPTPYKQPRIHFLHLGVAVTVPVCERRARTFAAKRRLN
jgi:hypothetical protein